MNCGPIHNLRCGPACVTISTCDNQRSSRSSVLKFSNWLVSKFRLLSMTRSLMSQLSEGRGGESSTCEPDLEPKTHCAFASTSSSIGDSSQILSFGMSEEGNSALDLQKDFLQVGLTWWLSRFQVILNESSMTSNYEERVDCRAVHPSWRLVIQSRRIQQPRARLGENSGDPKRLWVRLFVRLKTLSCVHLSL